MKKFVILSVLIIFVVSLAGCSGSESGFENTKWGMTITEVMKSTDRRIRIDSVGNAYSDEDVAEIKNVPNTIVEPNTINYYFGKGKGLTEVVVSADPAPGKSAYDVKNELKKYYDESFEPTESEGNSYQYKTDFGSLSFSVTNFGIKICFSEKQ